MLGMLARYWWALALRGVLAIIFGALALIWPGLTLFVLIALFGAYALVDGIFAVIAGIASYGRNERWWAMLLEGIAGIILGLLTFFYPGITALVLVYFIAAWALITGIFGMNVLYPGEGTHDAFWVIIAALVLTLGGMLGFFRWKRWL